MKKQVAFLLTLLALATLASCSKDPCRKGHTYEKSDTVAATCVLDEREVYTCKKCKDSYEQVLEGTATGHHFADGYCRDCGYADVPAVVRDGALLFTLNDEGKGYTVKLDGATATGEVVIPATCGPLPVVAIEPEGFRGQAGMTSVVIPDGIVSIGNSAFEGCTGLTDVTLGQGVITVGERAFHSCINLLSVTMRRGVEKIGAAAFGGCGRIEKMVLPFVGGEARYYQLNPNHPYNGPVHVLGYIFGQQSYSGAQKVTMCHDYNPWGAQLVSSFYIPSSLRSVEVLEGNYEIGYYYGEEVKLHFTLMQGAFDGCSMIRELILSEEIGATDAYVLRGCTGLETLICPGLTTPGSYGMEPLTSIKTLDAKGFDKALMPNVTNLTLREVKEDQTFAYLEDYTKLTDLTLYFGDDVKTVKLECISPLFDKLTGLMLPSAEVEVEEGVLSGIATLKRAALPYNTLTSLNMACIEELTVLSSRNYTVPQILFARATNLRSLTLDAHVTALPTGAFQNCTALAAVTLDGSAEGLSLPDTVGRWLTIAFGGEGANPLCHGAALYFNSTAGHTSAETLTLPEKITAIGAYAFDGCSNIREITLGGRIAAIGQNAFRGTAALDRVVFDGTLFAWCSIAFEGADANPVNGAKALVIDGGTVTDLVGLTAPTVSAYAFYGYLGLAAATIPEGVQCIGTYAFAGCASLASLTVPTTVTVIDAYAFFNCTALYSATFDDPSGWYRYEGGSIAGGVSVSSYTMSTPSRAADALIATYVNYVFKKVR